jgi:chromosome partitioning protein
MSAPKARSVASTHWGRRARYRRYNGFGEGTVPAVHRQQGYLHDSGIERAVFVPFAALQPVGAICADFGGTHTRDASARVLNSLRRIIEQASHTAKPEKILIDTSPFFGGATHLAWVAADALIIPVRVDQHSIEALRLTLGMLKNPRMDFQKFNAQAGLERHPKVHAIVMTHCGWNRQRPNTPDGSTRFFVERAIDVAKEFADVFSEADVSKCFYLLDDFHSSGRISGKQRIPLAKLESGKKYIVEGQRLEVNPSVDRYKREVANLTAAL